VAQSQTLDPQSRASPKKEEFAVLIVDDTIIEKLYTDESALITTYWDHSHKRYVKGVNLLSLFYQLNELALPISAQLIEKSQPQLRQEDPKDQIQKRVHQKRVPPTDAPSRPAAGGLQVPACRLLVRFQRKHELCADLKHHFIFALESSRTVALSEKDRSQGKFQRVDALVFPR
jgi:hypothetical protein